MSESSDDFVIPGGVLGSKAASDVVIIGGGVVGSSAAWHLRQDGFKGRILIVERDLSYLRASSWLAMGGIRQQFCTPVTVQMVQFSVRLFKTFDQQLGTTHSRFLQRGYLFLADAANSTALMKRYEDERRAGAIVQLLSLDEIRQIVPDVYLDDILFGVFGPEDGYANPRQVLYGFQEGAKAAGAEYRADEVVGIEHAGGRVTGVRLASHNTVSTPMVVNAAGAWAGRVAAMAGLRVPVEPMRQMLFRCELPEPWPYRFPMLIDPGGVHWRHEELLGPVARDSIIVAFTNWNEQPGENFKKDHARWARDFHPAMIHRLPALKDVSNVSCWAGLYEMTPDHNPVLGFHPALEGLIFANGFSGHGLMMSPATGKIVSELVRTGRSTTFEIGIFAPDRFDRGALVHDAATI